MKKMVSVILILIVILFVYSVVIMIDRIPSSSEEAIHQFLLDNRAEDQISDPLILFGKKGIPDFLKYMEDNRHAEKERYMISALGSIADSRSLPLLKKIAQSGNEKDYIRCDAIMAWAQTDLHSAQIWLSDTNYSNQMCQSQINFVLTSKNKKDLCSKSYSCKSYLKAFIGRHE